MHIINEQIMFDLSLLPPIVFLISLLVYHISEPFLSVYFSPSSSSNTPAFSSFLLSPPYVLALSLSFLEHLVLHPYKPPFTRYYFPPGLVFLLIGHYLRLSAWLTARQSFSHLIRLSRHPSHVLVTHGVYRYVRHPAYLGWYIWAVAGQFMLGNPVSMVVFALVAKRFFVNRVKYEEFHLSRMFGQRYARYKQKTRSYLPGVD